MKISGIVIGVIATAACAVAALAPAVASAAACNRGEVCLYDLPNRDPAAGMIKWAGDRADIIHFGNSRFRDRANSWTNRSAYRWCVYDVVGNRHILLWRMNPGRYDSDVDIPPPPVASSVKNRADYARRGTC